MRRACCIALLLLSSRFNELHAQGTKTREDPSKYGAHAQVGSVGIGADLWGPFVPLEQITLAADGFLVVEVALFAPPETKVTINPKQFVLKVNGQELLAEPPGMVTTAYIVPDMRERHSRVETDAGVGPVIVSTGRDPVHPKFPGDPDPANYPPPPRTQDPDVEIQTIDPVKAVRDAALPEGSHATPISGYLFYAYSGKLKRVKHAEIEYTSELGTAILRLR